MSVITVAAILNDGGGIFGLAQIYTHRELRKLRHAMS
jgi:hypothetical protein